MKRNRTVTAFLILMFPTLGLCSTDPTRESPWLGVHVMLGTGDKTEQLARVVGDLAEAGINAIVAEINYGYEYESHPELRSDNPSSREAIKALVEECRTHGVRLIPQFQCLGHQSWKTRTFPLLTEYPQFDETPGAYPNNEGIYCRSWCPLHPEVNPIIFELMDELIEAFDADALHVGMDEVFLIGEDDCPRCKGRSKAELFARALNDYHKHIVGKHKIEMLVWGDRLIDADKISYGKWEASDNGTAGAVDLIPRDIIICDWHYEPRQAYESIPMFLAKGFRVWPASWRKADAARNLIDYSRTFDDVKMLGHLNTTWGAVGMAELTAFEPLVYSTGVFAPRPATYLSEIKELLRQKWPNNRTINIVCHGHSVPAGYFKTPTVDTLNAYPHLLHQALKKKYPFAVINVIVTAIGGESSDSGEKRFSSDVLSHQPDVITIDYALNDRRIGLDQSRQALTSMIDQAQSQGIKVILLTPTGDLGANLGNPEDPLNRHAELIRDLARSHGVGLADSLAEFQAYTANGGRLEDLMSQSNHPNRKGHELAAKALMEWF
ncbi:MAG: family 20 glycosylhydrolase [Sedimentisphaerales bacterium]|nr:family 20 glycosylhydrolase [Sedimentisphaerales bacterium]